MATLVELSNDVATTSCELQVVDYDHVRRLCRSGIWVGRRCEQRQRIVLSYEHDPEVLYVGWSINGTTVLDPGYGLPTDPRIPSYAPGMPDVRYETGVNGFYHRIALSVAPDTPRRTPFVSVLYRRPDGWGSPANEGPGRMLDLRGVTENWPAAKLEEERRCWRDLRERLRHYSKVAHVGPGDPVQLALERVFDPDDMALLGAARAVAELDPQHDADLIAEYTRRVSGLITRLTLGHVPSEGAREERA
jgi:hypothetical protein